MAQPARIAFDYHDSLSEFAVSKQIYLNNHQNAPFNHIATSILVLDTRNPSCPRVLLLQRAASDSSPNLWELPGGACDDEDESILHGAARELREEAGLCAVYFSGTISDPRFFTTRSGKSVCQFTFAVKVDEEDGLWPNTRLDPKEHQQYVWASEDEVKAKVVGSISLKFTSDEVEQTVKMAFRSLTQE